ncbi:MAG: 16S rRNA (uracil(1498)-N(3))-methyltransferase [Rickettsiaceae bacterium]|nr:16S rRNA (uracil(1498)-N(3))-methyltransferase [Rickettsiaceae bacterium]
MKISATYRIYVESNLSEGSIINLNQEQSHYLTNVLRLKIGDVVRLFNENSGEYQAYIDSFTKKSCNLKISKLYRMPFKSSKLSLIQSVIKNDRMAQILDMSTQLGVSGIFPVISDRSQVRTINKERFEKIIIESSEQSERLDVPHLHEVEKLEDLLSKGLFDKVIMANENEEIKKLLTKQDVEGCKNLAILVGPEGGFTDRELSFILSNPNVCSISLGSNVLRSETAASAICAQVNLLRG